jgi:hypothetical protein
VPIDRRTYLGLFLASFAALMCEVALTRLFSFSLWYHFAYMTISVALLGYGAAGSAYYAFPSLRGPSPERILGLGAVGAAVLFALCLAIVSTVPFDPSRLFPGGQFAWRAEPIQYVYLTVFYLAVTAPFFAVGLCITVLLSQAPRRIPQLYFADLLGAGAGCFAAVMLLMPLGAPGVIALGTSLLAVAGFLFAWRQPRLRLWVAVAGLIVAGVIVPFSRAVDIRPSETKFATQILADPNIERLARHWNPVYRVDVFGGKNSPLHHGRFAAWGVSERFEDKGPENLFITYDGDATTLMYRFGGDFDTLEILDHSMLRLPYLFLEKPEVLVIGAGGGVDLLTALKNGARQVTGIELNAVTVRLLKHDFVDYNGNVFNRPDVTLRVDEGRNFVRRGKKQYDLIQITGIDTLAAVYSGAYVLSESYLYTVEAMHEYLDHLSEDGVLAMVRGDWRIKDRPPLQILRLLTLTVEALEQRGIEDPSRHIMLSLWHGEDFSTFPIFSMLVGRSPFTEEQIARVREHLVKEAFRPWHFPGSRFDNFASRLLHLTRDQRDQFLTSYPFNLEPPTDDRPFFFNFLKWRNLVDHVRARADYTFASGQLVLGVILVQCALFAALLILAPLLRLRVRRIGGDRAPYLVYFACLGVGFIFIEISYIQRFTLFLGSPVFSLSVILASLLVFSGMGSYLSGQLRSLERPSAALARLVVLLCVLNGIYIAGLPSLFDAFLGNPLWVRIGVATALLAPAGLVMGAFLPVGMRVLTARAPEAIPWAWAANGVASVVGATLSIVLAMGIGFRLVNLVALGIYLVGVALIWRPAREVATGS